MDYSRTRVYSQRKRDCVNLGYEDASLYAPGDLYHGSGGHGPYLGSFNNVLGACLHI
jgi:hypothetical protein